MSFLLALFSIGIGASLVKEVAKDVTKIPARSQMQQDCKNGTFDVVKNFEDILYVCDVKRKKHNSSVAVLPNTGYEKCLKYIREHHLSCQADEGRFIRHYKKVLSEEIAERQSEWDKKYFNAESKIKAMVESDPFEIVRFTYFDVFMGREDVEEKVNDLCANTFLGDFLVGQVKVKEETSQSYTEIWALKIPVSMKYSLKQYYEVCANKCGYIR